MFYFVFLIFIRSNRKKNVIQEVKLSSSKLSLLIHKIGDLLESSNSLEIYPY